MKQRLRLFAYFGIFWITFQLVIRASFLIYNHRFTSGLSAREILMTFAHGFKMDLSLCGYFLMLTAIILAVSVYVKGNFARNALHVIVVFLLLASCLIVTVDAELYRHWGFRLNTTPLFYAGSEAVGSVDFTVVIILIVMLLVLFSGAIFIYGRLVAPHFQQLKPSQSKTDLALFLGLAALMFLPIRGSFTVAPMNTGFVYFHKSKPFANHAAINVVWNFLYSLTKSSNVTYPENFFDPQLTRTYFTSLYPPSSATTKIFDRQKPNIILFILESFTADVIEPLGGEKSVTPNFNRLCKEGILFDSFYASGDRTDKGIISVLSGYPAQPVTSIIKFPAKTQRLPYLSHHLNRLGYRSSFVYGGDIDFANFRSYLTACQFNSITSDEDFPSEWNKSKWGVHDHLVLERAFAECDSATAPFFKVVLTLSSHEPFDVPHASAFSGNDEASLFLNSCNYTDKAIGDFVAKAKASSWWENTVILFVADHGHRLPRLAQSREKERFRIPLLLIGGAVKTDSVIHTLGGQTDIANTLLAQLGHPSQEFRFSKDLLADNVQSFAAYFFNDGYGFMTPDSYVVYDNTGKQFVQSVEASGDILNTSKAYQQMLFTDYNKR
jgi:phosphoglycerol transferase MdoB-like AlkP superfamily enzyme